ncbi:T9SS type A sorting domain-containing protein [Cryomorpha ignava]|uniref:T9SS type A sorting domain-containing protein n=1 Tax=Cryomorpha ignava TaxID=101383 RepID=A0A7K3WYT4_9FLAO|nr:T9SS type A sorting domain-containing protein [Cryomorpha ignava]NEN25845.1 T9SS type A sorting domain-containing protein [Cryomorpha ignava]
MKKSILLPYILLFIFSATSLIAQPDWQWGQEVRFNAQNIAVDTYGNSYVTWSLQDPYEIDGDLFISNGQSDAALTSFDCNGAHRWTKIIGGSSGDVPLGVDTDTLGGVYVTSNANGGRQANYSINIDSDTTIISDRKAMLLVKYDTEGDFKWLRMPEDTVILNFPDDLQLGVFIDVDVATNGDCFVYSRLFPGTYAGGAFEATYDATLDGGEDIYALKYNSDGIFSGGIHFDVSYTGSLIQRSNLIRDHYTGKFYMSGYLSSDDDIVIFGGEEVTANNYVVQFDSLGFVNWRISTDDIVGYSSEFVGKPSVDEFGNVYVTGNSYNNCSLGDFTFNNSIDNYNFPIFAKIDSSGNIIFTNNASVPGTSKGTATAYSSNKVAVTGSYASEIYWGDLAVDDPDNNQLRNVFLAFFAPSGIGLPTSLNALYGSPGGNESSSLLTADNQGNFYVGGHFSGQLHVGDGTLYNQTGTQEGFIAKFGTDSCYCPLPTVLFTYDTIPNQAGYNFAYTGSADADSVIWDFGDGQTGFGFNPYHFFAESGIYTVCATAFNSCGSDSVCIAIDALGPVGIKAINGFEEIRVYPNPAHDVVYINNALPGTRIDVINAVGQNLGSNILQSSPSQIDISTLPPGVYLLQLTGIDGKRGYGRFVKQ